jgi:hypothetical protein
MKSSHGSKLEQQVDAPIGGWSLALLWVLSSERGVLVHNFFQVPG